MSASVKSVFLESFQSHGKTRIELPGPGQLCVIVGPTDSGKTAIVRALRLLFYNVPQGLDYIQVSKAAATVAVEMSDGTKIVRERSKSVNRYRVVKPGNAPQVFEGFGLNVPLEVQEATGVRVVSIGDMELALNLSEQLDGPFLGNKQISGPARAKVLGKLAGTEEVDAAQQAVGLDLHRAGQEEMRLTDDIKALNAKIAEYDYLPRLAEQISELETLLASVKEIQGRLTALESAKVKIESIGTQRAQALGILARWGGLAAAVSHVEYAADALTRMRALAGYKISLVSMATQRTEWSRRLDRWAGLGNAMTAYNEAYLAALRQELLANLATDICTTREGIRKAQSAAQRWAALHEATVAEAKVSDAVSWLKDLLPLRDRLENVRQQRVGALATQKRWAALPDAEAVISAIPALQDRLQALCTLRESIIEVRGGQVVAEQHLSIHTKALGDAQSLYADTLIQLGTCPTCGSKVSPESIKSHIKEVA